MAEEKKEDNLISVFIDGDELRVPPGTNMIEAAKMAGKEIPHYCYHTHLTVAGNCRMCLVELGMPGKDRATGEPMLNEDGTPKIMYMPKPAIACATNAAPNMHIKTKSELVRNCQEGVMEFLLTNHPLDCPVCDQAGECRLQEFATEYGRGYSRFVENKNVKPKRTRLGPRVTLDDERCILCSRCIRFCQEVADDDVLGFIDRGSYSTLTCFPGKELANNYSLNTVDICPVGALTSTDFRFQMRVWFLKETRSICPESSVGCNTVVWSREGKIYRVTPRRNDAVNDSWMPDSGRELFKPYESPDRLARYISGGRQVSPNQAIEDAAKLLKENSGSVAVVGSGRATVEEQYLLRLIADALDNPTVEVPAHLGEGDGILLSEDRTPNSRGALVTGLTDALPQEKLSGAVSKAKVLLVFGEDIAGLGVDAGKLGEAKIIYIGTHPNATSEAAEIVLPGLGHFEKSGSYINQQFRLQKFHQAVPGPAGVYPDLTTLTLILRGLTGESHNTSSPAGAWTALSASVAELEGLSFAQIPDTGQVIVNERWSGLDFPEGKTLHYSPEAEAETAGAGEKS